ncbi:hypothetical protein FJTKL_08291 [Diaporthe vaccinii]|uniref:Uncharacterized protein n=1 Tax=Diaporthe vaccinii TaxID=105482 RepID=A0ABR4ESJ8_9PEZI
MFAGDDTKPGDVTTRSGVATIEFGGETFWAVLDNLICKSWTNLAGWSSDKYAPWYEAITKWWWDLNYGVDSFWAYLALIWLGYSPTTPFFKHVFLKLKTLGCLRGIKKDVFFEKLALLYLERLKPQLNSDELLSMAIHFEAHEWVYHHRGLAEVSTAAQARAGEEEADGSPTASTASAPSTSGDHTGSTPPRAAGASGEGEQGGGARKRKGAPGRDEQHSKKRRLGGEVKEKVAEPADKGQEDEPQGVGGAGQKRSSIFIYDDDSDVL